MNRYLIEFGTGIDLHGSDPTKATLRAIDDALHRCCLCGLQEILEIQDLSTLTIVAKIGCPYSARLDLERIQRQFPFGNVLLKVSDGGLVTEGAYDSAQEKNTEILAAVVSLTVCVPPPAV